MIINMMFWFRYIFIFGIGLFSYLIMLSNSGSHEKSLIGTWEEISWEYEKVNKTDSNKYLYELPKETLKDLIGENLIIHEAETWSFFPNGTLHLKNRNSFKSVKWRIKGRGNILQITHEDTNLVENYNIATLSNNNIILNFETNVQARGIAKLTFNRISKN